MGYTGSIYPINPNAQEIAGVQCYPDLDSLPEAPEFALVVLPVKHVLPSLESCARRGVKAAIVVSAGFAETGEEGARAQERMRALALESGMVICGPNSLGILNFIDRIPLTFGSVVDMEAHPGGDVALVSQSGGLLVGLANRAFDQGVHIGYAVATGNEADLTLTEAIAYMAEEPSISVIVTLIEAVRNGPEFLAVSDRLLEVGKPLIACKMGRSESGSAAARSHTGALAGSYEALQAVFRHRGVIEALDIDDLFPLAATCLSGRFPKQPGIGVITESGGAGAIVADRADDLGLETPALAQVTQEKLKQFLPKFASGEVTNPYDVTAVISENPVVVGPMAEAFFEDPAIGSLVVITAGSGQPGLARIEALAQSVGKTEKPVFGVTLAGTSAKPSFDLLRKEKLPAFYSPGKAVEALAALRQFEQARGRSVARAGIAREPDPKSPVREALEKAGKTPTEFEAKAFLKTCGLTVVEESVAATAEEAVQQASALGFPVALKVLSPQILHKTEVGGICLNLADADQVAQAFQAIMERAGAAAPEAEIRGVLVSRMVPTPLELIAGIHRDPTFGPLILFGLGGIWVEVFDEVSMRPAPITGEDAREMVGQLRAEPLLKGARNMPSVPQENIEGLLLTLSEIAIQCGDRLSGVDINPLVPDSEGNLIVLDAAIYLT